MSRRTVLFFLLIVQGVVTFAQKKAIVADPGYPKDYFQNPLDIPILLAGNFGECRPGHFHSGLDIKTLGKENQPVHAAADGYISRIKMDKGGFGHALYITHPNGYTTLYAHLNKFAPAIQQYLRTQQYEKKQWDVDLQLPAAQFPVKKGQQVAWSGNTGASSAPHLHFEIRNTQTEHPLNPQLFGLTVVDTMPPVPVEVVLYKGNVYGSDPLYIPLAKKDGLYRTAHSDQHGFSITSDTIPVTADFTGIGVNVDDYMDKSGNTITFYNAELYLDDNLQAQVVLDDIGYEETRYINAYADHKTKHLLHKWVQCMFQLPGNHLGHIFRNLNAAQGRLNFKDMAVHKVTLVLTDNNGNVSKVVFYVKPDTTFNFQLSSPPDLADCTPFYVSKANTYTAANIAFTLDEKQLYEDICFRFRATPGTTAWSEKFAIHTVAVPVHHYFDLQVKPVKAVPAELQRKVVMMYDDDATVDGRMAAPADNGWYKAKVRSFGTYWLDIDTIPPVIRSLQKNGSNLSKAKQVSFEVKDAVTSVKNFSGYLGGKWVCFEQHGSLIFYEFDEHCTKGKHKLVFTAEDENGNRSSFNLNFVK